MRTLLVNPPFFRFLGLEQDYVPLSLLAVGSQMAADGDHVLIKNMEIGSGLGYQGYTKRAGGWERYLAGLADTHNSVWNDLRELIVYYNPDRIGVTVLNVKFRSFQVIHKIAREYGIPVFAGGPHTVIEPESYPEDVEICSGEYESRLHDNRAKLDSLPFPNFDILLDSYSKNAYAHLITSRGCPFHCRFCSSEVIWQRKVTLKSADRIISEMNQIVKQFGSDYFTFWDEVFTLNKPRLHEFCEKYSLPAKWRCDTRADALTDAVVRMMVDAGCGQMSVGVESGVDHILKYIGKGENTAQYARAADALHKNGVEWKAYCIIGFPEETIEDMRQTVEFVKSLHPFRITLSFFTPYKGTPLYAECLERGLLQQDSAINDFFHQGPNNYFCTKMTKQEYSQIREEISQEVDNYNREALLKWC